MYFPVPSVKRQSFRSPLERRIKEAAHSKPIDISQLASEAGLNESSLYKMFRTGSARIGSITKLANILEINPKELLDQVESKSSNQSNRTAGHDQLSTAKRAAHQAKVFLAELPKKDAKHYVPYYDIEVTASKIELYFEEINEAPAGYVYAPQYQGCLMFNVKGNSMYDLIYPGARLYVHKMTDLKYIDFGQVYLVVTNSLRVLKYICRHPTDDTKVILASHNPQHDSWEIEKADILNLFIVKGFENQTAM